LVVLRCSLNDLPDVEAFILAIEVLGFFTSIALLSIRSFF
jgi:hypothetical protein